MLPNINWLVVDPTPLNNDGVNVSCDDGDFTKHMVVLRRYHEILTGAFYVGNGLLGCWDDEIG